ncbi:MAG: hypothetical protein ACREXY_10235, partial [Gammaproteobacteria bacterium]
MTLCRGCGAEIPRLEQPAEQSSLARTEFQPRHLDLAKVEGAFDFEGGFSRPQWDTIGSAIERTVEPENRDGAWDEAAMQWLEQIAADLGGNYHVSASENFLLVSPGDEGTASNLLR